MTPFPPRQPRPGGGPTAGPGGFARKTSVALAILGSVLLAPGPAKAEPGAVDALCVALSQLDDPGVQSKAELFAKKRELALQALAAAFDRGEAVAEGEATLLRRVLSGEKLTAVEVDVLLSRALFAREQRGGELLPAQEKALALYDEAGGDEARSKELLAKADAEAASAAEESEAVDQIRFITAPAGAAPASALGGGEPTPLHRPGADIAPAQSFVREVEPNDTFPNATSLGGSNVVGFGNIFAVPVGGDTDFWKFTAAAGDRVYAAVMTSFGASDTNSVLDLIASDGVTVLETDLDDGTFSTTASTIAGKQITTAGTYYLKVRDNLIAVGTHLRPYHLHFRLQSGSPSPEVEPNNTSATATPLPLGGWVSGTHDPATDVDYFSFTANAGDTVFLSLDADPERDNIQWNPRIGLGLFGDAGNQILVIDDASTGSATNPLSEAFFMTVKKTGTYYAYVDTTAQTTGGPTQTYHLSVTIHPSTATGINCATYDSTDIPKTIGPGTGLVSSTITVPGNPRIEDINVDIRLDHALMNDLDVHLRSPAGNDNGLFSDIGATATAGQASMDLGLDDEAGIPIATYAVDKGMIFQPELSYRLDWFKGENAGGTWTLDIRDDLASNGGTLTGWSITICQPPAQSECGSVAFGTDFESGAAGFTHSGTQDEWELGLPTLAPVTGCNSGVNCWKTDLDSTYNLSSNQDLLSPSISLAGRTPPIRLFWASKYHIESASFDHAWVEVSEVGNPANTKRVWEWLDATMNDSVGNPATTLSESAGWGVRVANIDSFAGLNVQVKFHFDSDGSVILTGWAIDDVVVTSGSTPNCDDGNACTVDACNPLTGGCTNSALTCNDSNACTTDTCNPTSGCVFTNNSLPCNDGNLCTTGDTCSGGSCGAGVPVVCPPTDSNPCTADSCNPATGACVNAATPGVSCSDSNPCTTADTCNEGACFTEGFDTATAPALPTGWTTSGTGTNPFWATATSPFESAPNSAGCDDPASTSDKSLFSPVIPVPAAPFGTAAITFRRNHNTEVGWDGTRLEISINGGPYAEFTAAGGVFTTGGYTGTCNGLGTVACWNGNTAGAWVTSTGTLPATALGQNVQFRWHFGSDASVGVTGFWIDNVRLLGCTPGCSGGPPPSCDDLEACTIDTCAPATGCVHTPTTATCNDGNACTSGDNCATGVCLGSPVVCNDSNSCTTDTCAPATGCVFTSVPAGTTCDDASVCTTGDTCAAFTCAQNFDGVTAPALPAGWTTTVIGAGAPWATVTTSFDSAPNAAFTNDVATASEQRLDSQVFSIPTGAVQLTFKNRYQTEMNWDGGVLEISIAGGPFADIITAGGSWVTGGYNVTLNTGTANPLTGRPAWSGTTGGVFITTTVNLPAAASGQNVVFRYRMGSDGSVASTGWWIDTLSLSPCGANVCLGTPISCDDSNPCTVDTCSATAGCLHTPTTGSCDDGNACTSGDTCASGTCGGVTITCNDGNTCTTDTCAPATGCVFTPNIGATCSDSNLCTTGDICVATTCGQNFDTVTPPALPAGWTTSVVGAGAPWATVTTAFDSSPNSAFTNDVASASEQSLFSNPILIPAGAVTLTFRNRYQTESNWDGGVLEISIAGGPFVDIITAGGTWVTGGYNLTLNTGTANPLTGRMAWSGNSTTFITTTVNLPGAASGQSCVFRWRMGSDGSVSSTGWWIDTLSMLPCSSALCLGTAVNCDDGNACTVDACVTSSGACDHVVVDVTPPDISCTATPVACPPSPVRVPTDAFAKGELEHILLGAPDAAAAREAIAAKLALDIRDVQVFDGNLPEMTSPPASAVGCSTPCTTGTISNTLNPYYDVYLSCGDGSFTARTGVSHPLTISSGVQSVIYGGGFTPPVTGTSDVGFHMHAPAVVDQVNPTGGMACSFNPPDTATEPSNNGLEQEWDRPGIAPGVNLRYREEMVAFGSTAMNSGIRLTLGVTNLTTSTVPATMGVKWQIDLQNAGDDGPLFGVQQCTPPTSGADTSTEHEWAPRTPAELRDFYRVTNNAGTPVFSNYTSTTAIAGFPDTGTPDRLVYGWWIQTNGAPWSYPVVEGREVAGVAGGTNDSSVLYYYGYTAANGITIAPGQSFTRSVVIFTAAGGGTCGGFIPGTTATTVCADTCLQLNATATDACSTPTVTGPVASPGAPTCSGLPCTVHFTTPGTYTYSYTANDTAGNVSACNTVVTVLPATDPACNQPPVCNGGGPYTSTCRDAVIDNATVSDPNEDGISYTWTGPADVTFSTPSGSVPPGPGVRDIPDVTVTYTGATPPCGVSRTVTLTVNDGRGGSSTCTATINFDDNVDPTATAVLTPAAPAPPADPASAASACSAAASAQFTVGCASTDNCDPSPSQGAVIRVTNYDVVDGACVVRVDDVPVTCGELVELRILARPCPAHAPHSAQDPVETNSDGVQVISGVNVELRVTATDACGNTGTGVFDPTTAPSPTCVPLPDGTCCPAVERPEDPNCPVPVCGGTPVAPPAPTPRTVSRPGTSRGTVSRSTTSDAVRSTRTREAAGRAR